MKQANILTDTDKELLAKVRGVILTEMPDAIVLLYGSAARGERTPDSDYDLLIVTPAAIPSIRYDAIRDAIYDITLSYGAVVSLSFCSRQEWDSPLSLASPFRRIVEREAIAL